jgi:hypothetical protein
MTVLQMVTRSCVFSDDRIYRYRLDIAWGEGGLGNVAWCLLNPSTADGSHLGRGWQVTEMLSREGIEPQCLGINRDGQPKHPLYTSYTTPLRPYP